jgi:hypothetical protein
VTTLILPASQTLPLQNNPTSQWVHSLLQRSYFRPASQLTPHSGFADGGSTARPYAEQGLRTVVAMLPEQFRAAEHLVRRRYAWRGYRCSWTLDFDGTAAYAEGQPVTLLAVAHGRLLGTLTVRADLALGLLAEQSYRSEIERLRSEGCRIGELVKLAVEEGVDWKHALNALVQSAYMVMRAVHVLTDVLIEVNPRHVRFYQRVFGFVVAASERICARTGAPSVLMRLDLARFDRTLGLSAA